MLELEYCLDTLNLRLNEDRPRRHVEGTGQCSSKIDLGERVGIGSHVWQGFEHTNTR